MPCNFLATIIQHESILKGEGHRPPYSANARQPSSWGGGGWALPFFNKIKKNIMRGIGERVYGKGMWAPDSRAVT
jgi:hypothetical protein